MHVTSCWEAEKKKKSKSNGWNFFTVIKKLKHFIIPMLATWENACHTHFMLATGKKKKKKKKKILNLMVEIFLLLLKI